MRNTGRGVTRTAKDYSSSVISGKATAVIPQQAVARKVYTVEEVLRESLGSAKLSMLGDKYPSGKTVWDVNDIASIVEGIHHYKKSKEEITPYLSSVPLSLHPWDLPYVQKSLAPSYLSNLDIEFRKYAGAKFTDVICKRCKGNEMVVNQFHTSGGDETGREIYICVKCQIPVGR